MAEGGPAAMRSLSDDPPDAFVIDLGRLPSQGRDIAGWLRRQKATRAVPIVFIEGDPEKTQRVRDLLPDAVYTTWGRTRAALSHALRNPPARPVVPGAMDGYAGAPLPKKLGIRANSVVLLINGPDSFAATLDPIRDGARLSTRPGVPADVVLLFVRSQSELDRRFPVAARSLADGGKLWIIWPKKASGQSSDLGQIEVRRFGLDREFVDYRIGSIDSTWSGLCFARRAEKRP
jgi:CheY-like chemotaxis protein